MPIYNTVGTVNPAAVLPLVLSLVDDLILIVIVVVCLLVLFRVLSGIILSVFEIGD